MLRRLYTLYLFFKFRPIWMKPQIPGALKWNVLKCEYKTINAKCNVGNKEISFSLLMECFYIKHSRTLTRYLKCGKIVNQSCTWHSLLMELLVDSVYGNQWRSSQNISGWTILFRITIKSFLLEPILLSGWIERFHDGRSVNTTNSSLYRLWCISPFYVITVCP